LRPAEIDDALQARAQQALALLQQGRVAQSESICRQILAIRPRHFHALHLLGISALQQRRCAEAARFLGAAIEANPAEAAAHSNLAAALLALQRPRASLECCDRALALKTTFAEAWSNRGDALCALGEPSEALASYDRAASLAPTLYAALFGRGNVLLQLRRYEDAVASYQCALRLNPGAVEALTNCGNALLKLRQPEAALPALEQALRLSPDFPEALNNRGSALQLLYRSREALASYAQALRIRPNFASAYSNSANVWLSLQKFEDAIACCDQALALEPSLADALNIRAAALRALDRLEEAANGYEQLIALAPEFDYALGNHYFARAGVCDWRGRAEQVAAIGLRVTGGARACQPLTSLSATDSAGIQLRCARIFVADRYAAASPLWRGERYAHARLRVAYLSADFCDHPVSHLLAGVLERHCRGAFETIGVSLREHGRLSAMGERMRGAFEHFHDVSQSSDRDVALRLRDMEVDIAVDLTGHTRWGRLGILAFRPAALQVGFLGYTGSSGADYIDYLIADSVAIPAQHDRDFSERIVRLPHCFLPNDDRQPIADESPSRRDLGLPDTGFVFCAFNNAYKINPIVFDCWARLLQATAQSVLWLRDSTPSMVANLRREARARGLAPERLVFAPRVESMDRHLARYRLADLFLDTLPYGAHATARDALWAGLPVVTCLGEAFASRVAGSLLSALGLRELVTTNLRDYESLALRLATSPTALTAVRDKLAQQRAGPAFDTDLFRRHLEAAYLTMWRHQQRSQPPESFDVAAIP
jgi:predicted O-linked N-acetylglucosamine transferase (SPINDLY family)